MMVRQLVVKRFSCAIMVLPLGIIQGKFAALHYLSIVMKGGLFRVLETNNIIE